MYLQGPCADQMHPFYSIERVLVAQAAAAAGFSCMQGRFLTTLAQPLLVPSVVLILYLLLHRRAGLKCNFFFTSIDSFRMNLNQFHLLIGKKLNQSLTYGNSIRITYTLDILTFMSNHNIHKSSCGLFHLIECIARRMCSPSR